MDKEKLKAIFVEEASEIIEKLDVEIINLEERPNDKDLLNELFRGVHTLKGSANSFGFRRLGEFVHSFEDVLDHYRSSDEELARQQIDVFLDGVDVIKEVFNFEVSETDGVPDNYQHCIDSFHNMLQGDNGGSPAPAVNHAAPSQNDLSEEFGEAESNGETPPLGELFDALNPGEQLYKVELTTDDDVYLRGQDHATFFRILNTEGEILESYWDLSAAPTLQELDPQRSSIKNVTIYYATKKSKEEIEENFIYLEENEYAISLISKPEAPVAKEPEPVAKPVETPTPSAAAPAPTPAQQPAAAAPKKPADKPVAAAPERRSFVKIDTVKLDELFDSVGELVIAQNFLGENNQIKELKDENVNKTIETLSKITRLIQNRVMSLRMVAIRDTFEKMKRVVRDSTRKVNKEAVLHISGEDTEIDKTMVDALSDPLIHIIRNAVDHGLEATAEDRTAAGKDPVGNVHLKAYHKGGNIVIQISDDGRGINKEKVMAKAIKNGLVEEGEELSDQQAFGLIMQPGFSTADVISDISGRGVGLDVVRTSIENLRGKIEIESEIGKGSSFAIYLPLTLAIIDGMLVRSSGETFIIPTLSIIESFRPTKEIVHTAQGKGEFVNLREELLPIVRLNSVLELDDKMPDPSESTLVCAENEKGRFAILVDELVGRQQVVIKSLGKTLAHLKEVSGGAVLGNGDIALILNVEGLH